MAVIAIFAGADPKGKDKESQLATAYALGKDLAEAGFTTMTGGGPGLMDEPLRGAKEAGGPTIGITLTVGREIQSPYADNVFSYDELAPRQEKMIEMGDAYVALPGGLGTAYEIFNILCLKRLDVLPAATPLVLVGEYYRPLETLLQHMIEEGFVHPSLKNSCVLVGTAEEATAVLVEHFFPTGRTT